MVRMSTRLTAELALVLAVSLLGMTALVALLRSVAWVNQDDRYSSQCRLVGNETAELVECPTQSLCSLLMPNRGASVNSAQIFQSDSTLAVFSLCNEVLTDTVILVRPETSLPTRYLLQPSLGILRSFALQVCTMLV